MCRVFDKRFLICARIYRIYKIYYNLIIQQFYCFHEAGQMVEGQVALQSQALQLLHKNI